MNDDTALVQSNKFDLLVQKIEQKKIDAVKYDEYQNQLRTILKRIMSVYYFLIEKMNMPRIELTMEDFKIAEEKLRELAREKINGRWHKFWAKIGIKTAWQYYNDFGFFDCRSTPFGYWYRSDKGFDWDDWNSFDAEYIASRGRGRAVPLNASSLLRQIREKKI